MGICDVGALSKHQNFIDVSWTFKHEMESRRREWHSHIQHFEDVFKVFSLTACHCCRTPLSKRLMLQHSPTVDVKATDLGRDCSRARCNGTSFKFRGADQSQRGMQLLDSVRGIVEVGLLVDDRLKHSTNRTRRCRHW